MPSNEQVVADIGALSIHPPDDTEKTAAVKFVRRVLGDDVADILAYLGLS